MSKLALGEVVSGHAQATEAARNILISGGNAADAATTCLMMLCVVFPGATCLGGEAPVLVFNAGRNDVEALCGLGAAPCSARAASWFRRKNGWYTRGIGRYKRGLYDAATPAMLHLCVTLLSRHGTLSFEQAVEPVLTWLSDNKPTIYRDTVHRKTINAVTGRSVRRDSDEHARSGRAWWQDLQATLQRLIRAERQSPGDRLEKLNAVIHEFYLGGIAQELAEWYEKSGALLSYDDLARHTTRIEKPVSVRYGGLEVLKCGMWTQGPMVSQALRILGGFDLRQQNCSLDECSHVVMEALKLAAADRFRHFGDPDHNALNVDDLLADGYIEQRRALINPHQAGMAGAGNPLLGQAHATFLPDGAPKSHGTTTCTVADKHGNVVVATPSGCGSLAGAAGGTGVIHGTRLVQFVREPGHANRIETAKRPCITPSPTLVLRDGVPLMAASLTYGDYQDQLALHLVVELVRNSCDFNKTIASEQIVHSPLVNMPFHQNKTGSILVPKARPETVRFLTSLGHDVLAKNYSSKRYQWSVVYIDPASADITSWDGRT